MIVTLLANPLLRKLIPYAAAALAALMLYAWITTAAYNRGVEHTRAVYTEAIDAERERVADANNLAQEIARRAEASLRAQLERQGDDYARLLLEAAADPNAGRECLGVGSVRRLNNIGSGTP